MGMQRAAARARLAGLTAVAALALSACGSTSSTIAADPGADASPSVPDASSTTSSPDVTPASGPTLSAGGFSFRAPKGWADVTDQAQAGVLLYAANPTDDNPLMITVRRPAQAPGTLAAAAKAASRMLSASGGTNVRTHPATTVGGNRAAHVTATQAKPGSRYQLDA
jgi:hypothetical protein